MAHLTFIASCIVEAGTALVHGTFNTEISVWVEVVCFTGAFPGLDVKNSESREGHRNWPAGTTRLGDRYREHDSMDAGSIVKFPLEINDS